MVAPGKVQNVADSPLGPSADPRSRVLDSIARPRAGHRLDDGRSTSVSSRSQMTARLEERAMQASFASSTSPPAAPSETIPSPSLHVVGQSHVKAGLCYLD